jgi:hypothetical protein
MTINQIESLPCSVQVNSGLATITFTMPEENVNAFVALLSSLANLFRGLCWKTKTNIDAIHERINTTLEEREQRLKDYETCVADTFKTFLLNGISPKEALSRTIISVKEPYPFASYDNVKSCLTKNKLLKKTGFYKSRHTIL